jgi:hypothetical protein
LAGWGEDIWEEEDNMEERGDQEMWDPHVRNMEFAEWCHFVA